MRAQVFVTLKPSVFDPQGRTIADALRSLGYAGVEDVRQGKYFEISLDGSMDEQHALESVEKMAREVLSNPIIEDYRVELEA